MKKSTITSLSIILSIFLTIFIFSSCKKKFDEPPAYQNPNITANTTIAKLKTLHTSIGAFDKLPDTSSMIIAGIVVADDYSGCFYKQIVIQDSTGAIVLLLNNKSLFLNYPRGRKVFVNVHGLVLSDDKYNGYQTLGMIDYSTPNVPASVGIPAANIPQFVIQGSTGNAVVPFKPSFSALTTGNLQDPFLGAYIQLDKMEFPAADTASQTWGDSTPTKAYVTIPAKNCSNSVINFNTSPYCNFSGVKIPSGNGTVYGIYSYSTKSVNGTAKQMLLVDTADVKMNGNRCGQLPPSKFTIFDATTGFATITAGAQVNMPGWLNFPEAGVAYYVGYATGGFFAKITNYKVSTNPDTSWLISPSFAIPSNAVNPTVIFNVYAAKDYGAKFTFGISSTYDGSSLKPSTFTWDNIGYVQPINTATGYPATQMVLQIPASYLGKSIYLGFKYVDADGTKNTAYEIDAPKVVSY